MIRFVFNQEKESENWEYILDNEGLKDFKITEDTKNFGYTETTVTSGVEVVTTVRLLAEEYDLMVVGRAHGMASQDYSGLMEWVELPELRVIGDLLAAKELSSKVSVLVVQQQQQQA